jgi:TetR/AcrR family transcriptional regulator, cholesterol catabolism regulator
MEASERILKEATQLFTRYGIRSVSMDDIAHELGMSKKTIYQHFEDKDALVKAVIAAEINGIQKVCLGYNQQAANAIEEIFLTMEFMDDFFRNMNPSILYDMEKFHNGAYQLFQNHKEQFFLKLVKKNLVRGIEEELYRPEISTDILARFRMESSMLPMVPGLFNYREHSLAEISHELLEHFLYGVVSIKGHKLILKYKQERQKKPAHESETA